MLTKNDISQIKKVIESGLKNYPTKQDLADQFKNYPTKQNLTSSLKPIKDDISQIRKDTKTIVGFFDREYLELRKRIEKIEFHLNI